MMESASSSIDSIAEQLASRICEKTREYGSDLPFADAKLAAASWLGSIDRTTPEAIDLLAISPSAIDELANTIVTTIMLDLAEERPGTNPWSHERNVPLPFSFAYSQLHMLSAITDLALHNNDYRWAENTNANVIAFTNLLNQHSTDSHMSHGESKTAEGVVYVPQPAMAYVARLLRNTADKLARASWEVPEQGPFSRHPEVPAVLQQHASILEKLTQTFGRRVNRKSDK